MTKIEVAKLIDTIQGGLTVNEFLVALANAAAAAEREACAKDCESHPGAWGKFFAKVIRDKRDPDATPPENSSIRKSASAAGTVVPRGGIEPPTP